METTDRLCIIPPNEWIELRDLFRESWPEHHVAYATIDNYIRWYEKDSTIKNLTIYCLNGSWRKDGTYLVVDRYQLFVYSLESSNCVLEKALHLLDWSGGLKVSSILSRHRKPVIDVITAKSLEKEYDSETILYYMPKPDCDSLCVTVPEGFELKPLSSEDAAIADDVWPNRHQGSLFFLQRLAAWNANVGLYECSTGKLVAWCFRLQAGPLGALQVDMGYLRRGFGTVVAIATAKQIADLGHDCFALVNANNVPSRTMFERIGFKHRGEAYWIRTIPTPDCDSLRVTVPEGFELKTLSSEDAAKANDVWPNRHQGSLFLLQRLAAWNTNVGLYECSTGKLVAWCFRQQSGALGALQVDMDYQRRGFGTVVATATAKQIVDLGYECFAYVITTNEPPRNMFERIGFKHSGEAYWIRTIPTVPSEWQD
uniref:N-acetyltransferase domain-containing protein n=1 Tax=Anopheles minimus TaxID=112268 RepID=A0A182WFH2_9DIPT